MNAEYVMPCSRTAALMRADPQAAKLAFALLAVTIGVLPRLHHRLLCNVESHAARPRNPFAWAMTILVLGARGYTAF